MRLSIQLFAAARDLAGNPAVELELPEGSTVGSLRRRLGTERPALQRLLGRCAVAVNEEFAGDDAVLQAGQRIALLPPVSGGQ